MGLSADELAHPLDISWRSIAGRAARYARESPITLLAITALWWALPHPLLVDLPTPEELGSGNIGLLVVSAIAVFLGWMVAAVGVRISFVRYIEQSVSDATEPSPASALHTRAQNSSGVLHFLGALAIMWLVAAVAATLFLVLTGLIILPASRVDGVALYSSYVAPGIIAVVFLAVRIRYSLGIETPLQHHERVRRGLRNGITLFREHRLLVAAVVVAVHLFYAIEPLGLIFIPDNAVAGEIVRGLAAVVRTSSLVVWLSFYHEARAFTEEELE